LRAAGRRPKSDRPGRLRTATLAAECGRRGSRRASSAQTIRATPPGVSVKAPTDLRCASRRAGSATAADSTGPTMWGIRQAVASRDAQRRTADTGKSRRAAWPDPFGRRTRTCNTSACGTRLDARQHSHANSTRAATWIPPRQSGRCAPPRLCRPLTQFLMSPARAPPSPCRCGMRPAPCATSRPANPLRRKVIGSRRSGRRRARRGRGEHDGWG